LESHVEGTSPPDPHRSGPDREPHDVQRSPWPARRERATQARPPWSLLRPPIARFTTVQRSMVSPQGRSPEVGWRRWIEREAPAEREVRLGPRYRAPPSGKCDGEPLLTRMTILSGLRLHPQEIHGHLGKTSHCMIQNQATGLKPSQHLLPIGNAT